MRMVTVTRMPHTVDYAGKRYGPSEGPIEIPEALANSLGLQAVVEGQQAQASTSTSPDAAEAQENLDMLLGLLAPRAQEGEQPDEVLRRLVRERDSFQRQVADLTDRNERGAAANREQNGRIAAMEQQRDEARREVELLGKQVSKLTRERDEVGKRLDDLVFKFSEESRNFQARITELEGERDGLSAELEPLRSAPLLPPDALERLKTVDGIGDRLAEKGLAALTAPAD